jgi:hypothetical protein
LFGKKNKSAQDSTVAKLRIPWIYNFLIVLNLSY